MPKPPNLTGRVTWSLEWSSEVSMESTPNFVGFLLCQLLHWLEMDDHTLRVAVSLTLGVLQLLLHHNNVNTVVRRWIAKVLWFELCKGRLTGMPLLNSIHRAITTAEIP